MILLRPCLGRGRLEARMRVGEGMLRGQVVGYVRLYDVPIRTTGRGKEKKMMYQAVNAEEEIGEGGGEGV